MVNKTLFLVLALWLAGSRLLAQESCTDRLRSTVEKLSAQCNFETHSTYHASYSLEQQRWEGGTERHHFDVYSNGIRHYLFSNNYTVVADTALTVSVQLPDQLISIGRSLGGDQRKQSIARVLEQQIKSIELLEVAACENLLMDGKTRTRLVLRCPEKYREALPINRVSYTFDGDFLYEVAVHFQEGAPVKTTTYTIHRLTTDGQFPQLEKAPTDFILDPTGQLRPEYTGFALEQMGSTTASYLLPNKHPKTQ